MACCQRDYPGSEFTRRAPPLTRPKSRPGDQPTRSAPGHPRPYIGMHETDGLPSIPDSRCVTHTVGSSTPASGPIRAVAGMDGSCQKEPHTHVHSGCRCQRALNEIPQGALRGLTRADCLTKLITEIAGPLVIDAAASSPNGWLATDANLLWRPTIEGRIIVIVQPYLEPYLGGDSFEAVRIGGFDKRCGV